MQLVSATLAEVRQALEDAYAVRQFGTGGNMAKLNVNTYLDICNTVVESFDESRFVFNADVFLPPTDTAVKISMVAKGQPQFNISTFKADFAWEPAVMLISRPITPLPTPTPAPKPSVPAPAC